MSDVDLLITEVEAYLATVAAHPSTAAPVEPAPLPAPVVVPPYVSSECRTYPVSVFADVDPMAFYVAHASRWELEGEPRAARWWREMAWKPYASTARWLRSWKIHPSADGLCVLIKHTGEGGVSSHGAVFRVGHVTTADDFDPDPDSWHGLWLSPTSVEASVFHQPVEVYAVVVRVADIVVCARSGKVKVRTAYTLGRIEAGNGERMTR